MAKTQLDKLTALYRNIESKQQAADELIALIADIVAATSKDGDVELTLNRNKRVFLIQASVLTNTISGKQQNLDAQVDNLLAKITINGQ